MSATPGELAERPHTKDESVDVEWRYLLVSESDVETAKGRGERSNSLECDDISQPESVVRHKEPKRRRPGCWR